MPDPALFTDVPKNLLCNPEFACLLRENGISHYVAGWTSTPRTAAEAGRMIPGREDSSSRAVMLRPGGRISQFIALTDLGKSLRGESLSLAVEARQPVHGNVRAALSLMGMESEGGTWTPDELGDFEDSSRFYRHGRGELIRLGSVHAVSPASEGSFRIAAEGLLVDWHFEHESKVTSGDFRNAVGILVEFENTGSEPVLLCEPVLTVGAKAGDAFVTGRALPDLSRQIPRTMAKLIAGEPIHILTLGSSIDRGSANPRLYLYEENPCSPAFKRPIMHDRPFKADAVERPDLKGYIGWFQHYFMCTGRLRLELMDRFDVPVDRILLNVMACDGSSIGESHCAFSEYTGFLNPPAANENGHADGDLRWEEIYPRHFANGRIPPPDLVVFGSGHNARIDHPDEAAVFEGAIRWFQRHYPDVEFLNAMWIREPDDGLVKSMPALCSHYGIPYLDIAGMIQGLRESCNKFAVMPDGGHPQAGAHYLWFKQLEKAFEVVSPLAAPKPQKRLPPRWNKYSYLWEGDMRTIEAPGDRIVGKTRFIVAEGPFNLWAEHDDKEAMTIAINGKIDKGASNHPKRSSRNASFLYGRLDPGERYVIEVMGNKPRIHAFDEKTAPGKITIPAGDAGWQCDAPAEPFDSAWGHPYGDKVYSLCTGEIAVVEAEGDVLSVDWLDQRGGGTFAVCVDGKKAWEQTTGEPFVTQDGESHWMENRRAIRGLAPGRHRLEIRILNGEVDIIAAGFYTVNAPIP